MKILKTQWSDIIGMFFFYDGYTITAIESLLEYLEL